MGGVINSKNTNQIRGDHNHINNEKNTIYDNLNHKLGLDTHPSLYPFGCIQKEK